MKRNITVIMCALFIAFVFHGAAFAQTSGVDPRLLGTWERENDQSIWNFGADGKGTVINSEDSPPSFAYRAIDGIIAMAADASPDEWWSGDYAVSSDGKALIIAVDGYALIFNKKDE